MESHLGLGCPLSLSVVLSVWLRSASCLSFPVQLEHKDLVLSRPCQLKEQSTTDADKIFTFTFTQTTKTRRVDL